MSNSEGVEAVRHQSGARQPNAGLIRRVYRQLFGNFGWPILLREMRISKCAVTKKTLIAIGPADV